MDLMQFIGYLKQFNADVLLIGTAVWALTALLKKTLLKKVRKKFITPLPFLLGIALYAAFAAITGGFSASGAAGAVISAGATCGSLATVIHVVYEQFLRGETKNDAKTECVRAILAPFGEVSVESAEKILLVLENDEEALPLLQPLCGDFSAAVLHALQATLSAS